MPRAVKSSLQFTGEFIRFSFGLSFVLFFILPLMYVTTKIGQEKRFDRIMRFLEKRPAKT